MCYTFRVVRNEVNNMQLTDKQTDIILNLILSELSNINKQNGNIKPLLNDYKVELGKIYQVICEMKEEINER